MKNELIPPPKVEHCLQNIIKLPPLKKCLWNVFAYVLNRDMIKEDGTLDDLHAMIFLLGSFDTAEKADKHIEELTLKTGHSGFCRAYYGSAVPLNTNPDPITVAKITVDTQGKLKELETAKYKKDKEAYERRQKLEIELAKEAEDEYDIHHIEHFKRQCTMAIKNRITLEAKKKDYQLANENYEKREKIVREHYNSHPEHEEKWLPYLKEKLEKRGELEHYYYIEAAYKKYRENILFDNVDLLEEEIIEHQNAIKELQNKLEKINNCRSKSS